MWETSKSYRDNGETVFLIHDKIRTGSQVLEWDFNVGQMCKCKYRPTFRLDAQSIVNKVDDLETILLTHVPHAFIITETWRHIGIGENEVNRTSYRIIRKYSTKERQRGNYCQKLF